VAWRNGVLASPRFQQWAARFPGLGAFARHRAGRAFDLVAGFAYTQVLLAAVELGLLDLLAAGARDAGAVAGATGLSEAAALRLLRAMGALDLAEEVAPGWWMLGQQGAALRANSGALAMVRHHPLLYRDLADPVALLRADRAAPTALSAFWHYAENAPERAAAAYSGLMAASQAMVAQQALAAYRFDRHRRLLDLGGGHGAFARAVLDACPALEVGVFDLPPVIAGAGAWLAQSGHSGRVTLHGGDFFGGELPTGHDCITLVRVLHDHDDAGCMAILRAARRALAADGRLVVIEPMAGAAGARAMGDAYFGFYLWAMNAGRPRTAREYGAMLESAGFSRWRARPTAYPVVTSMVVAHG
jgi:demethylspheroidene O-methyltransferase